MGRKLTSYSGEDCIYTPVVMARAIVAALNPSGVVLEPCRGDGAFTTAATEHGNPVEWCELTEGIDFFDKCSTEASWVITNPPFSKVTKFLHHSMDLRIPNIAFLVTVNTIWMNGKLNLLQARGYQLQEIHRIESPYFRRMGAWRQSGFSLGVLVIKHVGPDHPPIHPLLKTGTIIW